MTSQPYSLTDEEFDRCVTVAWRPGESFRTRMNAAYNLGIQRGRAWLSVNERLPESGVAVIAFVPHFGDGKNSRRIRAQYAAKHTLEQHAEAEGGDYDEATDTYWCEEGWYEDNEYEDIHWRVSDAVTHWQPLPQPPKEAV